MLRKISSYLFLVLLVSGTNILLAQAPKKPVLQRATQWKPEKGQYYFTHALTFEYENKLDKKKGEVVVYVDPVTGTMCFKRENSYGLTGKNFDFIIAFQDGTYIYCGADEAGKKMKIVEKVEEVKPDAETLKQQKEDFNTYCAPTGNKRKDFGWESIEYELSYARSEEKDKLWLTTTPFGIYPLYGFELIENVASLPVSFDYTYIFGNRQLLTEMNSKDAVLKLKSYEPNPFLAITRGYPEIKVGD